MEIGYLIEDPALAYGKMLRGSRTHADLLDGVREYRECADDAVARVAEMTEEDFRQFKRDLPKMRTAKEPKEVERLVGKWGDIVMPAKMMTASLIAHEFHVPWGLAFMRCEENGWSALKK